MVRVHKQWGIHTTFTRFRKQGLPCAGCRPSCGRQKGTSGSQTDWTPTGASGSVFDPGGVGWAHLTCRWRRVTWVGKGLVMGVNHDPDTGVETVEAYRLTR